MITGISCIVKPRINSGISCIRLIFFLFGNKIASLFDQKFRTKYLLFRLRNLSAKFDSGDGSGRELKYQL
jgi:hypothetical protein